MLVYLGSKMVVIRPVKTLIADMLVMVIDQWK